MICFNLPAVKVPPNRNAASRINSAEQAVQFAQMGHQGASYIDALLVVPLALRSRWAANLLRYM
jgi:hypothetical protein